MLESTQKALVICGICNSSIISSNSRSHGTELNLICRFISG